MEFPSFTSLDALCITSGVRKFNACPGQLLFHTGKPARTSKLIVSTPQPPSIPLWLTLHRRQGVEIWVLDHVEGSTCKPCSVEHSWSLQMLGKILLKVAFRLLNAASLWLRRFYAPGHRTPQSTALAPQFVAYLQKLSSPALDSVMRRGADQP